MEAQGGEQADDAVGHAPSGFDEGMVFGKIRCGQVVDAASGPLEFSPRQEALQDAARDTPGGKIPRTQRAHLLCQMQHLFRCG
jgi:hypothetical protein